MHKPALIPEYSTGIIQIRNGQQQEAEAAQAPPPAGNYGSGAGTPEGPLAGGGPDLRPGGRIVPGTPARRRRKRRILPLPDPVLGRGQILKVLPPW